MEESYDYYIVRVYSRRADAADARSQLAALEDGACRQRAFRSADELINILEQREEWSAGRPPGEGGS